MRRRSRINTNEFRYVLRSVAAVLAIDGAFETFLPLRTGVLSGANEDASVEEDCLPF